MPSANEQVAALLREYADLLLVTGGDGFPPEVRELTSIPGLGPARAFQLYQELRVSSVTDLSDAIRVGKLRDLKGFGPGSEDRIRRGIEIMRTATQRGAPEHRDGTAAGLVAAISAVPGCTRCSYAGSLRRVRETIGDIDLLAGAPDSAPLMTALTMLPETAEVIARGKAKTSIRTPLTPRR